MENVVKIIENINSYVNDIVWGIPMLCLLIFVGIMMTFRTKFFQIFKANLVCKNTFLAIFTKKAVTKTKEKKAISQFQALTTALAATIGTGNIAGVATAIAIGGPGAVFWMWVSAFFGMMTSFSENVLGIYYRKKNCKGEWSGGAMYYIEEGLKNKKVVSKIARPLSIMFAIFCICASFGIGNIAQINSISGAMKSSFSIPPLATGITLSVIAGLVIIGGIKRIGSVTEKVVPFMAISYMVGALSLLLVNFQHISTVFSDIFKGAFGITAIGGGISGALIKQAMTLGFKRGVFSNEAGLGSSVMVNCASDVKEPVVQGMWGIFAVFVDTIIVCTLTAFAVLSTGTHLDPTSDGVAVVTKAFTQVFGNFAGSFISIAILLFAFSTTIGWSYYGEKSIEYLFGTKAILPYKCVFVPFIIISATMSLTLAWDISDTLNGLMALPNLIGVVLLSGTVIKITNNYLLRKKSKSSLGITPMVSAYKDIQDYDSAQIMLEENK